VKDARFTLDLAGAREADLLAYVEGSAIDADAQRRLERAFAKSDALRAWADAAVADRASLRDWLLAAESDAPGGLATDAMAQAERESLVGAPAAAGGAHWLFRVRTLATAAVVLIGATTSVIVWRTASQQQTTNARPAQPAPSELAESLQQDAPQSPPAQTTLALREDDSTRAAGAFSAAKSAQRALEQSRANGPVQSNGALASATSKRAQESLVEIAREKSASSVDRDIIRDAMPAGGVRGVIADADQARAASFHDAERAMALAQQGRLALVATTKSPAALVVSLTDFIQQASPGLRLVSTTSTNSAAGGRAAGNAPGALGVIVLPSEPGALTALRLMLDQSGASETRFTKRKAPLTIPASLWFSGQPWWRGPVNQWWPRIAVEVRLAPALAAPPADLQPTTPAASDVDHRE